MNQFVIPTSEIQENVAGAVVWWSLSGHVDADELKEALALNEFEDARLPPCPSPETVLLRAARHQVKAKRENVRPVPGKRGTYVFLTEHQRPDDEKSIEVENQVQLWVEYETEPGPEGAQIPKYRAHAVMAEQEVQQGHRDYIAEEILRNCKSFEKLLFAEDISAWLLAQLNNGIGAVGLRDRGGFYFVPRDKLGEWRELTGLLKQLSSHRFFEIPAMRTEEAVEAILVATRAEFSAKLEEVEQYLAGKVSTRGLNAYERELEALQGKIDRYAAILGVSLEDVTARRGQTQALLTAARVMDGEEKAA